MLIRGLTQKDIPSWLALAHEGDDAVRGLNLSLATFYDGFDAYMTRKIEQNEAFMALNEPSGKCLGIVAFSKKHNRITFLGAFKGANFQKVGGKLMEYALNQLDNTKEITTSVISSTASMIKQERALYESIGFTASNDKIIEAGVPAVQMKLTPKKTASVF